MRLTLPLVLVIDWHPDLFEWMYAKHVVGAGKVQFFHNGNEVAWVKAADLRDPKLSVVNGSTYLVRTVELVSGKNVLEIHVDGKRVWRAAYSG